MSGFFNQDKSSLPKSSRVTEICSTESSVRIHMAAPTNLPIRYLDTSIKPGSTINNGNF